MRDQREKLLKTRMCKLTTHYSGCMLMVKLLQSQRISIVMGIMSAIIIIGTTSFSGVKDYLAFLTIVLSILVLLKIEYLDNESS